MAELSWKHIIPTSLGLVVLTAAAVIVAAAMFLSGEGGEKLVHLYKDVRDPTTSKSPQTSDSDSGSMEVLGRWRGLTFVPAASSTARALGVREAERGVVVAEVAPNSEAARSGILAGDVVVGADQKPVRDLTDLYQGSQAVSALSPVLFDVRRGGQPVTLVVPGRGVPLGMPASPQAREQEGPGGFTPLGGTAVKAVPDPGATPAAWGRPTFFCPRDGVVITGQAGGAPYACPRCRGAMQFYPQATP